MPIGPYCYQDYVQAVERFHGYAAPGVLIGGWMVEVARQTLPEGTLFDAICETPKCLPDAVQLLTPCTTGNGWLKVLNLGRFALSLYDKYQGTGVRVFIAPQELAKWSEIHSWLFKSKPKAEQDKDLLLAQIEQAATSLFGRQAIRVRLRHAEKRSRGPIAVCELCAEAYPARDGAICRACQGESPYEPAPAGRDTSSLPSPPLQAIPLPEAAGRVALHDMTRIIPGQSKGPEIIRGQRITAGDLCRLQQMGRNRIYTATEAPAASDWVHEDEAAQAFAEAMAGRGVVFDGPSREGKINLKAERYGLLMVATDRLERFNLVPGVMCASRHGYTLVDAGKTVAGTRAIPLYLPRREFIQALAVLAEGPLFHVLPLRAAKIGILVTGTEVFQGLIQDRFVPIVTNKVVALGCQVVASRIVPDDRPAIAEGVRGLLAAGADFIITTAGLSVDPDDVTRAGLIDVGASDLVYGAPILPGAMTLLAHIGAVPVLGVPACALYFKTTSLDLLLPRLLANVPITREDLAGLGHGALCLECKVCSFPKCPFGK